jgi:hypothetical protein
MPDGRGKIAIVLKISSLTQLHIVSALSRRDSSSFDIGFPTYLN